MPKSTDYCLGCDSFVDCLTDYRVIPKVHYPFSHSIHSTRIQLCFKCVEEIEKCIDKESKGKPLPIPRYFHLLKDLIMGEL